MTETVLVHFVEALFFGKKDRFEKAFIETPHFAVEGKPVAKDRHARGVPRPFHPIELRRFLGITREIGVEEIGEGAAGIPCQSWSRRDCKSQRLQ
eukprot:1075831-Pleurochrysis_carterae.AAC.1